MGRVVDWEMCLRSPMSRSGVTVTTRGSWRLLCYCKCARNVSRRESCIFFFSSRRRHTRLQGDWSSDVCSSDLVQAYLDAKNGVNPRSYSTYLTVLGTPGASYKSTWTDFFVQDSWKALPNLTEIGRASCRERV